MNILSRYIIKNILSAIILVLLTLIGVEIFLELVSELKDLGRGNYTILAVLLNVPLFLPADIYQLFPIAALIGSLIGLGKLASQNELVVMGAAGVSRLKITLAVLNCALIMLFFVTILGEVVAPKAIDTVKYRKMVALSGGQTLRTKTGIWIRQGNDFVFIKEILGNNHMSEVTRYQFDQQQRLKLASFAEHGEYQNGKWLLQQINQTQFENDNVISQHLPRQWWRFGLDRKLLGITNLMPDQMTLTKLYAYIHYSHQNKQASGIYEFNFWKRLIQPLSTLVMIFLAVPFIFGPLRSANMGLRMVIGVIVGFCFYIMNQFLGPFSLVYQVPALVAAMLPSLIFAIIGGFLLFLRS